ncbi:MAG: diaminopimelate epimerase [Defluviitaleaceae bacterium]|nr:diaminopimelate epimerase [Defluviitaleaceae bacterium]
MNNKNSCQAISANNNAVELGTFSFIKMHGCGNDYIFFDCFDKEISDPEPLARKLSDRNKGIGGDGLILIMPSDEADAKMLMYNADGSSAAMCGNAIRCVGKYLYESGKVKKQSLTVETLVGVKLLELVILDELVISVRVNMGHADLLPEEIPVKLSGESIIGREVTIDGYKCEITCVGMGNPNAVVFHDDIDHFDLAEKGPAMECAKIFPKRTNFQIAQFVSRNNIRMRVWSRGAGEVMACGTGACAAAVAAVLMGYCDKDTEIHVQQKGGVLTVKYTDEAVYMTGSCEKVFEGTVFI